MNDLTRFQNYTAELAALVPPASPGAIKADHPLMVAYHKAFQAYINRKTLLQECIVGLTVNLPAHTHSFPACTPKAEFNTVAHRLKRSAA